MGRAPRRPRHGQGRRQECLPAADRDAGPAHERVAARREQRRRGRGRDQVGHHRRGVGPPDQGRVPVGRAALDQLVVQQRTRRCPTSAHSRDPTGRTRERSPRTVCQVIQVANPAAYTSAESDQQVAPVEGVCPRTRRDLEDERRGRPDDEEHRDVRGADAVVGEEQRVDRVERDQVARGVVEQHPRHEATAAGEAGPESGVAGEVAHGGRLDPAAPGGQHFPEARRSGAVDVGLEVDDAGDRLDDPDGRLGRVDGGGDLGGGRRRGARRPSRRPGARRDRGAAS